MGSMIDDLTRFLRKTHKGRTRIDWKEYGMSGLDEVEDLVRKVSDTLTALIPAPHDDIPIEGRL